MPTPYELELQTQGLPTYGPTGTTPTAPHSVAVAGPGMGKTKYNQNVSYLNQLQTQGLPTYGPASNQQSGGQTTPTPAPDSSKPPAQPATTPQPSPNPIQATSPNNNALQKIIDETNKILTQPGVTLSPENQAALNRINGLDAQIKSLTASATSAQTNGDVRGVTQSVPQIKNFRAELEKELQDLYINTITQLRQEHIASLAPSAQTQEVKKQLQEIKDRITKFDIETERQQEGQMGLGRALSLSQGQAGKVGRERGFDKRVLLAEENNLLMSLGLSQEADQARTKGLAAGLDYAIQDQELYQKALDRIQDQENIVFEQSMQLQNLARQKLSDSLEMLANVNPDSLSQDDVLQLQGIASQQGFPVSLLLQGLKAQYNSSSLDTLLKQAQVQKVLSDVVGGGDSESGKLLTPTEAQLLGVPYGTTRGGAAGITPKKQLGNVATNDLIQAQIAKNNVSRIAELISELGQQGPIIGKFRSANPYDTRVVELNNLLTQTVPGLARGIFKEVGVLTDTDINRYMQTLANTNLTKEQADNATKQLLKSINYSIKTQLDTFDKAGRDVREFDDLRESVSDTSLDTEKVVDGVLYRKVEGGWEAIASVDQ